MFQLILRNFKDEKIDFHLSNESDLSFLAVVKNSEISINLDMIYANRTCECYIFVPFLEYENVKINLKTNIHANNSKININIVALVHDKSTITLDGNLHIYGGIKKVEAKLYEETLLFGSAKYVSLIPGLRVDSPDVVASHGAKVQRISQERLFYMQSRGLDEEKTISMIIDSYSQQIVDKLHLNEKEKSEFYSMIN